MKWFSNNTLMGLILAGIKFGEFGEFAKFYPRQN